MVYKEENIQCIADVTIKLLELKSNDMFKTLKDSLSCISVESYLWFCKTRCVNNKVSTEYIRFTVLIKKDICFYQINDRRY